MRLQKRSATGVTDVKSSHKHRERDVTFTTLRNLYGILCDNKLEGHHEHTHACHHKGPSGASVHLKHFVKASTS